MQEKQPVWNWFATCGGPEMTLEVRLDGMPLHRSSFPLCLAQRDSVASQGKQVGRMEFFFQPKRRIVWTGYRETNDQTEATETLEVNVWQAGADPDGLTLGVSVNSHDRILTNTLHLAYPGSRHESSLVKGLVVTTYPAERK
jgi:hypothetical protein